MARLVRYEGQHAPAYLLHEHMNVQQPLPSRLSTARARSAHGRSILTDGASSRLEPVREVLCEPTRTQIVRVLSAGPLSVGNLASVLKRSKSATSQHLRVLRERGVVAGRRRGRVVIYSLVQDPMVEATVEVLDRAAALSAA